VIVACRSHVNAALLACAVIASGVGCAPKAPPLAGVPTLARLPSTTLPPLHQQIVFRWEYSDNELAARGEGVARIAPQDSVRLDVFLAGGFGGGHAFLIGDTLTTPGGDAIRKFLPPPAMLWAALGALRLRPAADTSARVDGDTLRADIGRDPTWRATFGRTGLVRLERIDGGRIVEELWRVPNAEVRYRMPNARRSLKLTITRTDSVPPFDETIWRS
jgi:hypothetical protein